MRATGRRRGFTLLEVLVVLAIIAVVVSIAVLSLGGVESRRTENAARRAEALLTLACERAAVTGRDLGIAVVADGLRFGYLLPQGWRALADDPADPLRPRPLGDAVQLELQREGEPLELAEDPPASAQLACLGSGEMTPFRLRIHAAGGDAGWELSGGLDGNLRLRQLGAGDG